MVPAVGCLVVAAAPTPPAKLCGVRVEQTPVVYLRGCPGDAEAPGRVSVGTFGVAAIPLAATAWMPFLGPSPPAPPDGHHQHVARCTAVLEAPAASESIRAEISEARRQFIGEKAVSVRLA